MLRKGKHHSIDLQRAWAEHGEEAFAWIVIETVPDVALLSSREQYWLDRHKAAGLSFNLYPTAGSPRGYKHSAKNKAAQSAARKGRPRGPMSAEHRANLIRAIIGRECFVKKGG